MNLLGDNIFGEKFRILSFGESHGDVIGVIIDGVPAGLEPDLSFIKTELDKRRPGQSPLTTSRHEPDEFKILSGIFKGRTTGAPLCIIIENKDMDSAKYEKFKHLLRPSQVDFSALKKYGGFADYRGSGRFSGRITAGFVIAGAIAKQLLALKNIQIFAHTASIGDIIDEKTHSIDDINESIIIREKSAVRALNIEKSRLMEKLVENVRDKKDSIGGTIRCIVKNFPAGIGGPVFNSLESIIASAMFSIPAIKGIEFGAGFRASRMKGSEHNDPWVFQNGRIKTSKNDSGGIIGGISIGMPIEFTVAVKPTASIGLPQQTVNIETMEQEQLILKGRHDPCIVPRAVIVVEAMTAIALVDRLIIEGIIPQIISP